MENINLKIKRPFKARGNKPLFELLKNSYSGSTELHRSPSRVLIRRQRQRIFIRKGRGTITSAEGRHFYGCR